MLRPDDYGARIAFVDYDGEAAFERYRAAPPKSEGDERRFVEENAPRMVRGVEKLRQYVADLRA